MAAAVGSILSLAGCIPGEAEPVPAGPVFVAPCYYARRAWRPAMMPPCHGPPRFAPDSAASRTRLPHASLISPATHLLQVEVRCPMLVLAIPLPVPGTRGDCRESDGTSQLRTVMGIDPQEARR